MKKILLFYKYVEIADPESIKQWQRELCEKLGFKGRIILAREGINATMCGSEQAADAYVEAMNNHSLFGGIDFKTSLEDDSYDYFQRLRIVVKDEIVNLGVDVCTVTPKDGGRHLTPAQAHELLLQAPEDLVIFDARNRNESRIGTFNNAIKPNTAYFRELPMYIDDHLDQFEDKQVLMFCTGGIRCERASAYLKLKGVAKEVFQIEGGIQRYVEQFPNGFFRGKNYVFDNRVTVKVNDDILGTCDICEKSCDEFTNCLNASCNKHFIGCDACLEKLGNTCSQLCRELLDRKEVVQRPFPANIKRSK